MYMSMYMYMYIYTYKQTVEAACSAMLLLSLASSMSSSVLKGLCCSARPRAFLHQASTLTCMLLSLFRFRFGSRSLIWQVAFARRLFVCRSKTTKRGTSICQSINRVKRRPRNKEARHYIHANNASLQQWQQQGQPAARASNVNETNIATNSNSIKQT